MTRSWISKEEKSKKGKKNRTEVKESFAWAAQRPASPDLRCLLLVPGIHGTDTNTVAPPSNPRVTHECSSHCVIAGEYEAEDKAKRGWGKLEGAPGEFLKLSTQVWEGARSSEQGGWAGTDLQSYSMVPGISPKSYRECLVAFKQGMTCANVDYGTLTLSKSGQNLCICWPPHYTQDSTLKSYPRDGHVNKEPLSSGQEGQKHLASLGTRSWQDTRKRKRQVDGKDAEVHQARENGRIGTRRLQLPHCWFAHCLRNTDFPNQAANAFARGATFIPPSWSFTFKASGYFPMVVLPFLGLTSMHWADSQLPERNAFLPCGRKDPFPRS